MYYQLAYVSSATPAPDTAALEAILQTSRSRNAEQDLTGLLIYVDRIFFQILEGRPFRVLGAYRRIRQDPRHRNLSPVMEREVAARAFAEWQMGFVGPTDLPATSRNSVIFLDRLNDGMSVLTRDPAVHILVQSILGSVRA